MNVISERSGLIGQRVARKIFEKRGNQAEAHLSEAELAAFVAIGAELAVSGDVPADVPELQPMPELTWRRIKTTIDGGKPFYWFAYRADGQKVGSVVWNRGTKNYHCEYLGRVVGVIGTPQAGRRIVENAARFQADRKD